MRLTPTLFVHTGRSRVNETLGIVLDTPVSKIRSLTRYNARQWKTFNTVTALVAHDFSGDLLSRAPESLRWARFDDSERHSIEQAVIKRLEDEGLSEPVPGVVYWRMHRYFKNLIRLRKAMQAREAYIEEHIASGHEAEFEPHMSRFQRISRTEMQSYAEKHPDLTWTEIPTRDRNKLRDRVNAKLKKEGIPPVGDELMSYQMEMNLMSWKIRTNREAKEEENEERIEKGRRVRRKKEITS